MERVAKLLLSLYGIKQGSHLWNKHMHQGLTSRNFICCASDHAVYTRHTKTGRSIIAWHVDNAITVSSSIETLAETCAELHKLFEMKEEDPDWLMGFILTDNRKNCSVAISQAQYVDTILKRFRMDGCNPVQTPIDPNTVLSKADGPQTVEEATEMKKLPYRKLVGAITWIAMVSRPDLAFASWKAVLRVLWYLAGTCEFCLVLGENSENADVLTGYSDLDWARDIDDRWSISGYIFTLVDCIISWNSKKQTTVAALSTEGEYMALLHTSKQAIWLGYLL